MPDSLSSTTEDNKVQKTIGAVASAGQDVVNLGGCASDERVEGDKTCGATLLNFILPAAVSKPFRQIAVGGATPVPMCVEVSIKMAG